MDARAYPAIMSKMSEHDIEVNRELRWMWVEPANTTELLHRLALGRDIALPTRELENLCATAIRTIKQLERYRDETENLLQEFVDDASYSINHSGRGTALPQCNQCGSCKTTPHTTSCVVGKAEALLRHLES